MASSPSSRDGDEFHIRCFSAHVVGISGDLGTIRSGEKVILVPESESLDHPTFRVLNEAGNMSGYLDLETTAFLAPLHDSGLISDAYAVIEKAPRRFGARRASCQVCIFVHTDHLCTIDAAITKSGIVLMENLVRPIRKSDEELDSLFVSVGKRGCQIAPLDAPDSITVDLLQHQREALGWLLHQEESSDLPPFWSHDKDGNSHNQLTDEKTRYRPQPLQGGVFADATGLGKRVVMLSLIATIKSVRVEEQKEKITAKRRRIDPAETELRTGTTLIVCPVSLTTHWMNQIEKHTQEGTIKAYLYHGERTDDKNLLLKQDIVITTYSILRAEFGKDNSLLFGIEWLRVILDECQFITNPSARLTKAVIALKAQRRWAVTGKPIQNGLLDLQPVMEFLRFQPFSIRMHWLNLIHDPILKGNAAALSRLQNLLGAISLRRTNGPEGGSESLLILPPKYISVHYVQLSKKEQRCYNQMLQEGRDKLRQLGDSDAILSNYSKMIDYIWRLRLLCNDQVLRPPDLKSWLETHSFPDATDPILLRKLALTFEQDDEDYNCPVCLTRVIDFVITRCIHVYCRDCICTVVNGPRPLCPYCRHPLTLKDLFDAPEISLDGEDCTDKALSAKGQVLLVLLMEILKDDPSSKSVVFSHFKEILILLQGHLKSAGLNVVCLDAGMSTKKKSEVVAAFSITGPDAPTILLAGLKTMGPGVDLSSASNVFLLDPWINQALEEQAIERVHNIGQTKEVRVVKLIVKDSIEDKILEMQNARGTVVSGVFGKKIKKGEMEFVKELLKSVFGL